jgi:hypothetical protein
MESAAADGMLGSLAEHCLRPVGTTRLPDAGAIRPDFSPPTRDRKNYFNFLHLITHEKRTMNKWDA